ncbi:hypothetical protein ACFU93_45190 [Streptomyces sp. NPDC057611]|uniref:hypothetical protein n=1 Tax=Streptomyces sp. NPDC057611 TaxID=3346182 RepID=UPI0036C400B8
MLESVEHFTLVLACELVAAVRALRLRDLVPAGDGELRDFYDRAADRLDPSVADRNLTEDVEVAAALLAGG